MFKYCLTKDQSPRSCLTLKLCPDLFLVSFPALIILQNAFSVTTTHITLTDFKGSEVLFFFFPVAQMIHFYFFLSSLLVSGLSPWNKSSKDKETAAAFLNLNQKKLWFLPGSSFSWVTFCFHALQTSPANKHLSLTFTLFTSEHLHMAALYPSPTKADLFSVECNTQSVLLWVLPLSSIESISLFPFSLFVLWFNEDKDGKDRQIGETLFQQSLITLKGPDLLK